MYMWVQNQSQIYEKRGRGESRSKDGVSSSIRTKWGEKMASTASKKKEEELTAMMEFVERTKQGDYAPVEKSSQKYARMRSDRRASNCNVYRYRIT